MKSVLRFGYLFFVAGSLFPVLSPQWRKMPVMAEDLRNPPLWLKFIGEMNVPDVAAELTNEKFAGCTFISEALMVCGIPVQSHRFRFRGVMVMTWLLLDYSHRTGSAVRCQ